MKADRRPRVEVDGAGPGAPESVLRRLRQLHSVEFLRFAIVGAINTAVDVGLFDTAHFRWHIGAVTSKVVSASVATIGSYLLTRLWAFAHRDHRLTPTSAGTFVAINAVGIGLAVAVIAFVRYGLGQDGFLTLTVAGNGIGIGLGLAWRFWALRRWVFLGTADAGPSAVLRSEASA